MPEMGWGIMGKYGEVWGSLGKFGEVRKSTKTQKTIAQNWNTRARASVCMRQARFALAKRVQMLSGERQQHQRVEIAPYVSYYSFESYIYY